MAASEPEQLKRWSCRRPFRWALLPVALLLLFMFLLSAEFAFYNAFASASTSLYVLLSYFAFAHAVMAVLLVHAGMVVAPPARGKEAWLVLAVVTSLFALWARVLTPDPSYSQTAPYLGEVAAAALEREQRAEQLVPFVTAIVASIVAARRLAARGEGRLTSQ